jgi:hypothetical protein
MISKERPWPGRAQLSDADLRFVVETVATERQDYQSIINLVRDKPDILDRMLEDDNLFQRLTADEEALLKVSPWLLFNVLLRRAVRDLAQERFTIERFGATERLPVFDSKRVVSLLLDEAVRDYLAALLASFVRTESLTVYYRSGRRFRRRTFSDLDVDDMIALAGTVADEYRFPYYRRIGDLCLFITGVFPEHVLVGHGTSIQPTGLARRWAGRRTLADYQLEAERFYRLAASHKAARDSQLRVVLRDLADNFSLARKPLNYITDRYIRLHKHTFFGGPN